MKKENIVQLFATFEAANPVPKTELASTNPYTMLVAIILSAQATDVGVNKATPALFARADTPEKMVQLGEAKLKEYIKTIGLFNSKARNVIAMSQILLQQYGGDIPVERELLMKLPGVGRKTANVWLNCVHGAHTIAVDTHVHRVSNRVGLCHTTSPEHTEKCLDKCVPKDFKLHAHHWLILHGRYICKARKPACSRCPVIHLCTYKEKII